MYNENLQKSLDGFLTKESLSQAKLSKMIGISSTALSQWRNNKYSQGNIEDLEAKIEEYLKLQESLEDAKRKTKEYSSGYTPISTSEDVYKMIQFCHFEKGMVIVHGDAGIGKTKAAEKYYKENPNSTIYIQATPSTGTLTSILKLLARALKLNEKQNKLDLVLDIRAKLENTSKVIIIDEAQHLKLQALEEIRNLSDPNFLQSQDGTGIVLIGNSEVYDRMNGKQEPRFAQLFSRIRMHKHYSTGNIKKDDITLLFPNLEDDKEIEFMHGISLSKWGIRGAVNVYNNAVNNSDISYKGLFNMALNMGIGALVGGGKKYAW